MEFAKTSTMYAVIALGTALAVTACDQRPEAVGQSSDRATLNIARNTDEAASRPVYRADDAALTAAVKAAIMAEPGLQTAEIAVATNDAVVTLTGVVASPVLKERAKQAAGRVSGVRSVVDNLQAAPNG